MPSEWKQLMLGGRVRVRLDSGGGVPVEVEGKLIGRGAGFRPDLDPHERTGRIVLDDGAVIDVSLDAIVRRVDS